MNLELPNLHTLEEIKVATDLFYWKASTYLLIVDYYSRYIEISSSFISTVSGVLRYCGPVACKLNICVYASLILGADISVDSAPVLLA